MQPQTAVIAILVGVLVYVILTPLLGLTVFVGLILAIVAAAAALGASGYRLRRGRR